MNLLKNLRRIIRRARRNGEQHLMLSCRGCGKRCRLPLRPFTEQEREQLMQLVNCEGISIKLEEILTPEENELGRRELADALSFDFDPSDRPIRYASPKDESPGAFAPRPSNDYPVDHNSGANGHGGQS